MVKVDLGLDISTSVIGVCVVETNSGNLLSIFPIKLQRKKYEDIWDKAIAYEKRLQQLIDDHPKWEFNKIYVEAAAMKFSGGFSTAKTIFGLASFNGIVSFITYKMLNIKPTMINVKSARKQLGIKINYKDKSKPNKEKVFDIVWNWNPNFPWETRVPKSGKKKGQTILAKCNQDMADAWIIVRGGQLIK